MMSASSSSSSSLTTLWRISFLTLRDEALTPLSRTSLSSLLHSTVFAHSHRLISAASLLPPHEVTSDLVFLMELFESGNDGNAEDLISSLTHFSHLIHGVSQNVSLELTSPSWDLMLEWFGKMAELLLGKPGNVRDFRRRTTASARTIVECLGTLRRIVNQRKYLLSENKKLLSFLLKVLECLHADLSSSSHSNGNQKNAMGIKNEPEYVNLWEAQTILFGMICEIFARAGPASIPLDSWQSVLEAIRKIMDSLTSKNLLVEDYAMSKFYLSVLSCLHLVLADPKGSLSDHVAGFVAALRPFFIYGLTSRTQIAFPTTSNKDKEHSSLVLKSSSLNSAKNDRRPYRPPHLRKKDDNSISHSKGTGYQSSSDQENSPVDVLSSDSDYSDSDGSGGSANTVQCSKVRVAAIVCIQDLCQNDPKSFSAQWTILLPTTEVLHPRKYEGNLMTCLLFDPHLKARMASASTLAAMLDGPASVFLQVAEYKESAKCGSFTALSTSLGQILMQLHTGVLFLIQRETHGGLLVSLFKILMLLVQSTPYSRMPGDLLPSVIKSLKARIEEGFSFKSDQTSLLGVAFSCLTAALATSPSSPHLKEILLAESSSGFSADQVKQGILFTIFMYSEQVTRLTVTFEALQALRAVSHNYPNVMAVCWEKVSTIIYGILRLIPSEHATRSSRSQDGCSVGPLREKIVAAAAKVLDESLRAISGFKGTEDNLDDRSMDTPFLSDCKRVKNISSAPFHGMNRAENPVDNIAGSVESGNEQWHESLERHIPLILQHASPMVRAAAVTCFAGITSSVFFSLSKERQDFILFSLINAAEKDDVSSVRSAACRAIGVIACFPQTFQSEEILQKFVHIAERNARDPLVPVRITSSWALANICDSLRRRVHDFPCRSLLIESDMGSQLMASLVECALHLTKDNDKIKANAVRALGNLSRLVKYESSTDAHNMPSDSVSLIWRCNKTEVLSSNSDSEGQKNTLSLSKQPYFGDSHWLEKMVQAFISCVTTGNVKVQWNVCHALSNLFLNETLRLNEVEWASSVFSILLLLLRDSSNFKIRIQAAAALAVPASICDYGRSFSDVVQSLENVIENLGSDKISTPSNMKYRVALEKQLISTMLHVLSLASSSDHQPLKDFLIKKAPFLEEWFKMLCKSVGEEGMQPDTEINPVVEQKKEMLSKAICSLAEVYRSRNQRTTAQRFEMLVDKNK